MNELITQTADTPLPKAQSRSYTAGSPGQPEPMRGADVQHAERRGGRPGESLNRADRYIVGLLATLLGSTIIGFVTIGGQLLDMQRQIGGLRVEMHEEIGGLRVEVHEEFGKVRAEMREEFGKVRAEMREEFGKVRAEMRELSERLGRVETVLQIHHGPLPGP